MIMSEQAIRKSNDIFISFFLKILYLSCKPNKLYYYSKRLINKKIKVGIIKFISTNNDKKIDYGFITTVKINRLKKKGYCSLINL